MTILRRIQVLCSEFGLNPSKLESELGFGKGTLYKWDKSSPNSDKLIKVAEFFGVSIDWLLGASEFRTKEEWLTHINTDIDLEKLKVQSKSEKEAVQQSLIIPDILKDAKVAAHDGEDDWTQEEIDKLAEFAAFIKSQRKGE